MSTLDFNRREIVLKIVYYGPGLGGKTASLQCIHRQRKTGWGRLVSLNTDGDRTLFFDYLPLTLPAICGFAIRAQLYTVPGQVHYDAMRKLLLNGTDGVVFVADSQRERLTDNVESLRNLSRNLAQAGRALAGGADDLTTSHLPWVVQYNKRDCPSAMPVSEIEQALDVGEVLAFESIATTGHGVMEALKALLKCSLARVSTPSQRRSAGQRQQRAS